MVPRHLRIVALRVLAALAIDHAHAPDCAAQTLPAVPAPASPISASADTAAAISDGFVQASAELRVRWDKRDTNLNGPLAEADGLVPGIAPEAASASVADAELRAHWSAPAADGVRTSLTTNVLLWAERPQRGTTSSNARFNELFGGGDFGAWQASVGKKIVAWDVGFGFRPNDFVQQEARRTLLAPKEEGRAVIEAERFNAESAAALVWVNPQRLNAAPADQRGADESALAARGYALEGPFDRHVFARWGRHTRASLGAALAWVVNEEFEVHASARALQRHEAWQVTPGTGTAPVAANPWQQVQSGSTSQALLGASWTGESQISVLAEIWHDGTALSDRDWDGWIERNHALARFGARPDLPSALVAAAAGNLAWQATPLAARSLRRDNVLLRVAWQPNRWLVSLDALVTPADRGRVVTAAVQWQGERVKLNAAWREQGGPRDAILAQLPQRRTALLAASWPL